MKTEEQAYIDEQREEDVFNESNMKFCPVCKTQNIVILGCGTILCKNIKCLHVSPREEDVRQRA